ncbi:homocysteine S-methyltransferase family protein [Alicyclobacillus sp.]|uniref:homocysteine S-methyltransferase family protein n=1 Tax=Alicyclobacillus sp. TaxID=61169 RepID=UPI0025B943B1|nr:homocysteine S-methyltransferase family protein [Alicyclobacillus sp.]MCL6516040.1 homocysteine S-methyltransferase family protein [Alicyclobacillus sp.]
MVHDIRRALTERILVLDGAMGTMIQQQNLTEADFGGRAYDGCNEHLCLTRPDVIFAIHRQYLEAGADVISTNSFGGTPLVLGEYGLAERAREINRTAAALARQAADAYSTADWPRFVAGSMGPTTKSLSVTGGATFDELMHAYAEQARGLLEGGVDLLLIETAQDLLNVKAASLGIRRAFADVGREVPILVSGTIEPMGTTLAGQTIEALYLAVEHLNPLAVGLNCATGPEFMRDHVRALAALAECGVSCYPNAGLPDEEGHYHETPASFAAKVADFVEQGWLNIVGGCCGTTPEHIRAVRRVVEGRPPRKFAAVRHPAGAPAHEAVDGTPRRAGEPIAAGGRSVPRHGHAVSGLEAVFLEEDNRPIFVGERTNVIGSRKFRQLIASGAYEAASEIARAQVRSGAQVIDICLADPDRDELQDMVRFLPHVVKKVKVPLMIDSTDAAVVEAALRFSQGKAIINSTNLEDGEPRLARFAELARRYGAALVVGTIDERGMAVTRERKLEVALRSVDLLVNRYGLEARDIVIDPLTFPVGTGDEKYIGSAKETIEGIRLIRERLPECPTILGISNVSFGLPPAGREVLNSVFLYECTKAGLGYAIVNTEKLERYASIPAEERALCERLLFETSDEVVAEFTAFYRVKKTAEKPVAESLPLEARLAQRIVDGTKEGLYADLDEALRKYAPLDIINGPLMDGMNEVGRLFNNNELIVAEVLQSAEVMKAAVAYLEPHMEKRETATKGTVLLATVKGDVHDIGKNLVEIIFANNGFRVVNLGIKVPPEQLIQAYREVKPDMIGLSGLLVKSAQQMVLTADDLRHAGIDAPLLVGGAALTRKFTYTKIQPAYGGPVIYAKDAMEGLEYANRLAAGDAERERLRQELSAVRAQMQAGAAAAEEGEGAAANRVSDVRRDAPVFIPPDLRRHVLRNYPLSHIRPYLNLQMLLGKHLGLTGNVEKRLQEGDEKARALLGLVEDLLHQCDREGWLTAHAVYRFFPAQADGDAILIHDPDDPARVLERFPFPRQRKAPYLCLADFVRPKESGVMDYVAFFTVTAGRGVRDLAERWKEAGDYLRSHALQALALEMAEAFAERLHQILRDQWGFPDPPEMTMRERFIARYQGIRVSFGYPACPDLENQAPLFRLLKPEDIGVRLTDGFMMDPEASVSAMVFAHPEARYFNVE